MLQVREVSLSGMNFTTTSDGQNQLCDFSQCRFKCSVDREWCYLDAVNSRILEITFPTDSLRFHVTKVGEEGGPSLRTLDFGNTTTVNRQEQATTKLLVKVIQSSLQFVTIL